MFLGEKKNFAYPYYLAIIILLNIPLAITRLKEIFHSPLQTRKALLDATPFS
jgi:hypothetical protein